MYAMGIDIGTTTVCGVLLDAESGRVCASVTLQNDASVDGRRWERLQDPERIWTLVKQIVGTLTQTHTAACIGLTGQMHGIVYTDEDGQAVSPLYTWQDERGNEPFPEDGTRAAGGDCGQEPGAETAREFCGQEQSDGRRRTYAEQLSALTGYEMANGFGLTTHFYNRINGLVPERAVSFGTIQDYIGMRLTGRTRPLLTVSDAASLGCFDLKGLQFDREALARAGLADGLLPECVNTFAALGRAEAVEGTERETGDGRAGETGGSAEHAAAGPVVAAGIGDNQASVIGSVRNLTESVLINVGTGSQVSVGLDHYPEYAPGAASEVEVRPVCSTAYLLTGAGLCGGRAYAALEQFLRLTVGAMTGEEPDSLYQKMEELLEQRRPEGTLQVDTRFGGTRRQPGGRGSIRNLGLENFTPEELILGVQNGMAEELCSYYREMQQLGAPRPKYLIGSGNGIRKNRTLRRIFEREFGLVMQIPEYREEAACGAALYALTAAGICPTLEEAQRLIRYTRCERKGSRT